jgi:hypothetical protein
VELGGPQGSGHGEALLRNWFGDSGLNLELGAFLQRGAVVVVSQEAQWSSGPGGAAEIQTVASVFRVHEGLIVSILRYADLDSALAAAGMKK